ncbi:uncharacterized protein LOC108907292 [Anoplophora glabripennis]|uniref:uncharacterized protein LOC108907292 n=1 Tax=Anoplophora glabripennis TaxID=217634 RepID=UPI000C767BA4|nr:uncharacterized protein LOC108907292 [Anoplophora glabripennis]
MDVPWTSFFIHFTFILFTLHFTSTFKQQGTCYFPVRWEGTWFQSGVRQPIVIEGPRLSNKGRCLGFEGDKFLVVDDKRACYRCVVIHEKHPNVLQYKESNTVYYNQNLTSKRACYRCVVIHEKHPNVLQYKETYCHSRDALPTLCSLITGDALLYSMFRENAVAVPCPFRGPFTFTYNRGHGECRSPVSSIDSCTEESKLLLSYQACPDVHGSESAIEELQCLATWKEGSSRYLVGKLHHSHATSNEDRFRCFVYEKASPTSEALDGVDYRVAQSGDATCNGLFSATEGSRTMTLKKASSLNKCRFPFWVANYNHWHTLDYFATYNFHHRNSTLRITNSTGLDMKVVCVQVKHSTRDENSVVLVTHFTMGCQNGYNCMSFYRRDAHVIEVQIGSHTKRREDACSATFFDRNKLPFVTLVTTSPETRACPYMGKFEVNNLMRNERSSYVNKYSHLPDRFYFDSNYYVNKLSRPGFGDENHLRRIKRIDQDFDCDSNGYTNLIIGCNNIDTMEFRTDCSAPDFITSYSCHGGWEENGTNFLITTPLSRASHGARRYCFMYKEQGSGMVMFSTSADSCDRLLKPGITGELIFNITTLGKCVETSTSTKADSFSALLIWPTLYCIIKVVTIIQR